MEDKRPSKTGARVRIIYKLRLGCVPEIDGVTAELIKYVKGSYFMIHICNIPSLWAYFSTDLDI